MSQIAAVFGSTGLVGNAIIDQLKESDEFSKVYCYARRPPMFLSNQVEFMPFKTDNFDIPDDIDVVFCALGTTIKKAGSKEDFREVDFFAVKRIAEKCKKKGIKRFIVVSSVGANANSKNFYLRTKGEMEKEVASAGIEHTVFIRPSLLLGQRKEKRLAEDIAKIIITPLSKLMVGPFKQYRPVKADKVAKVMVNLALTSDMGIRIIENREI